jgi:hypothetical protein
MPSYALPNAFLARALSVLARCHSYAGKHLEAQIQLLACARAANASQDRQARSRACVHGVQVAGNAVHVLLALQGEAGRHLLCSKGTLIRLLKRLRDFNEPAQCLILEV